MSYIAQTVSRQFSEWTAEDKLRIAYLNSRGPTSYLNVGDNEVVLMDEELSCFGINVGRGIYQRVAKSDFVTFGTTHSWGVNSATFSKERPASSTDLLFFDVGGLELQAMKKSFPLLKTFPATGTVTFFSTHDKRRKSFSSIVSA